MEFQYSDGGRSKYFKAQNVGDCCVRAICNATGKDYKEVYNELKKLNNGVSCRNGTPKKVWKKYLENIGWRKVSCSGIGQSERIHLNENELPSKGTYIVQVSKHLTCVKDGVLIDTYDCTRDGDRMVYCYYYNQKDDKQKLTIIKHQIKKNKRRFII